MSPLKTFLDSNHEILKLNHYQDNDSTITFKKEKENGFDIIVEDQGESIFIGADIGYHDHIYVKDFPSKQEALSYAFGLVRDLLSKNMRIRVVMKNDKPVKWILEYYKDHEWYEESGVALLFFNYFGKKSERIFFNDILPPRNFDN